jgi:hypothetical protein
MKQYIPCTEENLSSHVKSGEYAIVALDDWGDILGICLVSKDLILAQNAWQKNRANRGIIQLTKSSYRWLASDC